MASSFPFMSAKSAKPSEQTFETAIERLEGIVRDMEGEKLPLEELLSLYEEGTKLVRVCQDKLDAAEKRIEIITRNSAGEPQLKEFEPAAEVAPAPVPAAPSQKKTGSAPEEARLF
jgi:exodeoxyribonuclease VII small subunit